MDNSTQTRIRLIDYLEQLKAKGKLTFISTALPKILNVSERQNVKELCLVLSPK